MFQRVQDLLNWRATLLLTGRYDDLAASYIFPNVAFLEGRQLVLPNADAAVTLLQRLAQRLLARGVYRMIPSIKAMEIPRDGRFRVWVHWRETSTTPANENSSYGICYFRETETGLRSEMMDFSRVSKPDYR